MKQWLESMKKDIWSNLTRIKIFLSELEELASLMEERISEIFQLYENSFESSPHGVPSFAMSSYTRSLTDVRINLFFKCFVFVSKQAVDTIFLALYQARDVFESADVESPICNGSLSGKYQKLIIGVIENRYQYDPDILNVIRAHSVLLLRLRTLRNVLKSVGTIDAYFQHYPERLVEFVCDLHKSEKKKDGTLEYQLKGSNKTVDEISVLRIKPIFVRNTIRAINDLFRIFEKNCHWLGSTRVSASLVPMRRLRHGRLTKAL